MGATAPVRLGNFQPFARPFVDEQETANLVQRERHTLNRQSHGIVEDATLKLAEFAHDVGNQIIAATQHFLRSVIQSDDTFVISHNSIGFNWLINRAQRTALQDYAQVLLSYGFPSVRPIFSRFVEMAQKDFAFKNQYSDNSVIVLAQVVQPERAED